eukprot:TRINITY_DN1642_c0_g3_i1.p1 TRINITY_DN1642_c0_g3~~TRINITY_DN1642_c0_g3_i1.p1  ORF type:complete len:216 (+),score=32.52 TRINITY_DN1642_c0_g3_i1:88-735(+)
MSIITNDITKYSAAKLFSKIGKETQLFVRMSGTFTERGDADTTRDIRGFAIKFYTEEGNWDLLSINLPVFGLRDAKVGPDSVHSLKRDPRTSMWNPTQTWDYVATHPEGLHFAIMMYTDRIGTPLTFRHMHGYGCNTFSFVNSEKKRFWCKFHLISELGAKGMSQEEAKLIAEMEILLSSNARRRRLQIPLYVRLHQSMETFGLSAHRYRNSRIK